MGRLINGRKKNKDVKRKGDRMQKSDGSRQERKGEGWIESTKKAETERQISEAWKINNRGGKIRSARTKIG